MKFSMIFESVDRATKGIKKIMDAEQKLGKASKVGQDKAARAATKTSRTHSRLRASMGRVRQASARTYEAIVRGAKGATRAVGTLHRKTVALGKAGLGNIGKGLGKMKGGLMTAASVFGIATGSAALAANSMVDVAAQFEKFQTILETTEGSSEKAKKAMDWVSTFAVKTPYELDAVMDSFVKMRSYGLDPTNGSLKTLGDTSAAMGKPLIQAVEAMADAVTGENERLKEFGIKASKTGKIISYEYTNAAGQTAIATAKAGDRMAIQQTLMKIWGDKFGGSMQKLSATWTGMMANLSDLWLKFQLMIMQSGVFDWMKGKLQLLLDTINKMEADGSLQEWATKIGNSIILALEAAWKMAVGVYAVANQVGGFLSKAADWVGGWGRLAAILGSIAFAPTLLATGQGLFIVAKGVAMLGAALMANPIGLAVAAIVAGAYLIYRYWEPITKFFKDVWNRIKEAATNAWNKISQIWENIKGLFSWVPSFGDWKLPTLDWASLQAGWDIAVGWFTSWIPSFGEWKLPTLDWASLQAGWNTAVGWFTSWIPSFGEWKLPTLDWTSLQAGWNTAVGWFTSWIPSFGEWKLPTLDWASLQAGWNTAVGWFTSWIPSFGEWKLPTLDWTSLQAGWNTAVGWFTSWIPSFGDWKLPSLDWASLQAGWNTAVGWFTSWIPSFGEWKLPTLDWVGLQAGWDTAVGWFTSWVPSFGDWKLPTLDWSSLETGWNNFTSLFDGWSMPSLSGWISGNNDAASAIDKHTNALSGFAGSTGEAMAALSKLDAAQKNRVAFDATEGLAASATLEKKHVAAMKSIAYEYRNYDQGLAWIDQLEKGSLKLDQFQSNLMKVKSAGGKYADDATRMLEESFKLDEVQRKAVAFQKTLDNIAASKQKIATAPKAAVKAGPAGPTTPTISQSPTELNQISEAAKGAETALKTLAATAKGIPMVVQGAMSQVNSVLSGVSLVGQGQRIMQTLADGMASRASAVVAQVAAVTQKVRDHLPSSPAKTGPLSDLHKLKFAETIAGSIKSDPMVKAMTKVTAATLMATAPLSQVSAGVAPVPQSAAGASLKPSRAVQSYQSQAQSKAETRGAGEGQGSVVINYNPSLQISGDAKSAEGNFKKQLQEHSREIKRMMDEQSRQTSRRKH